LLKAGFPNTKNVSAGAAGDSASMGIFQGLSGSIILLRGPAAVVSGAVSLRNGSATRKLNLNLSPILFSIRASFTINLFNMTPGANIYRPVFFHPLYIFNDLKALL
jgi:hypothetical protein